MPQSLILKLVTQDAIAPQYLQDCSLQQLFFDLVEAVDLELGRILRYDKHNYAYRLSTLQTNALQTNALQTNALQTSATQGELESNLFKNKLVKHTSAQTPHAKASLRQTNLRSIDGDLSPQKFTLQYACNTPLKPQTECWWRIALLDDDLLDHLGSLWNEIGNETFQLGSASVRITCVTTDANADDWASSCSYQDIYESASSYERDIHLQLVTPIAFYNGNDITPLPTTDAVFQPLRKCWNYYSRLAFAPSLIDNIIPSSFNIQTAPIHNSRHPSHLLVMGCTGHISFRICGQADPLTIKRINTLADYTQYCGVGYNNRLGSGVIKRLSTSTAAIG